MPLFNTAVGDQANAPGTSPIATSGFTGELRTAQRHGRYQEAVARGSVYSVIFPAAALAVGSATAAGAFVLLNPANPAGLGKILSILDITTVMTANTPVATGTAAVLGALINPVFSAQSATVAPTSNLVGSNNKSVATPVVSGTYAVLPSVVPPGIRNIFGAYIDLAASYGMAIWRDEVAGQVLVLPGNGVNVFGLGGTPADLTVTITMTWEEIPILS